MRIMAYIMKPEIIFGVIFMFKKLIFESRGWPADSEKVVVTIKGENIILKITKRNVVVSTTKEVTVPSSVFLKKFDAVNIAAWEDDYFNPDILDGESWELKYYTTDGKIKKITGSNAYPDNYDELINLIFDDGIGICENV